MAVVSHPPAHPGDHAADGTPESIPGGVGTRSDSTADRRRRRRFRRRRAAVFTVLGVVLATAAYTALSAVAPLPAAAEAASGSSTVRAAAVDPAFPAWGSAAVGLVGQDDLLVQNGSTASAPIASMTKTITALVLLDKHPIAEGESGPTITFTDADVDILQQVWAEDGSWANVVAGERLTEKQALTAMLLPSANNYAISLANWGFGSVDAFLTYASSWLNEHGLTGTTITDPSGLDPGSVSTTKDLVSIGKLVLASPVLSEIVDTPSATLPDVGIVQNSNELLGKDGIVGIKTGWTDQAGHCLMFAASVTVHGHALKLVGVVTGAPDYDSLWSQVPTLLASVENGFHEVKIGGSASYGTYSSLWGQKAALKATKTGGLFVFSNTPVKVTVRTSTVSTAAPGDAVGTVTYTGAGQSVTRTLTVSKQVADPGLGWRMAHPQLMFL